MSDQAEARVVQALATAAADPKVLAEGRLLGVVVPEGGKLEQIDLDKFKLAPDRARGAYTFETVASFLDYAGLHEDRAATTTWVAMDGKAVTVFHDHSPHEAGWRDHTATLTLQRTPEWERWKAKDGKFYEQADLAEHIEDSIGEIAEPDASLLLEIVNTFQATVGGNLKSHRRDRDGSVHFEFAEDVDARAGENADVDVPDELELMIAPFFGENEVPIKARFRYRVKSGALTLGYKLERPEQVELDVIDSIYGRLNTALDRVYRGPKPA